MDPAVEKALRQRRDQIIEDWLSRVSEGSKARHLPRDVILVLYYFVAFNVLLAIFNLLPVPPLDGSAILFRLLPAEYAWRLRPFLQQYGFIFLIGFFIVGGSYLGDLIFGVTNVLVGRG